MTRGAAPFAALILAFAGAAGCSDDESVFNAEVGECIESVSSLSGQISELPETDCSEPHEGEIFFLYEHEGDDDDFPGDSAVQTEATEVCQGEAFEDYTGTPYADSAIVVGPITPTAQSWGEGDRESICVAAVPGDEVSESFRDNGEDYLLDFGDNSGGDGGDTSGGGDVDIEGLIAECEGGSNAACDELWFNTPVGSDEERIGATCGGRSDEELQGGCVATLGE
jgi:hypothetical protein